MATEAGKAYVSVEFDPDSMRRLSTSLRSQGSGLISTFGQIGSRAGQALGIALGAAVAYGTYKAFTFAKDAVIDFNSQLQQSRVAFQTLLGSSQKAADGLNQVVKFARETPFELQQILPVAQQLLGTGTKLADLTDVMTELGDAISATGGSSAQLDLLTTAYTQVTTAGTAHLQDLLQINNAVPGSMARIAKAAHMSLGQFREAVSAGQVSSDQAREYILKAFGDFSGAMERQSHTFQGAMSNVHDAFQGLIATAGRPIFNALSRGANALGEWAMHSKQAQTWAHTLHDRVRDLVHQGIALAQQFGPKVLEGARQAFQRVADFVTGTLIPAIQELAPKVLPIIQAIVEAVQTNLLPIIGSVIDKLVPKIAELIDAFRPMAPFITNVIAPLLEGVLAGALDGVVAILDVIIPTVRLFATVLGFIGQKAKPLRGVIQAVGYVIGFLLGPTILRVIGEALKFARVFGRLAGIAGDVAGAIAGFVGRVIDLWSGLVTKVLGFVGRLAGRLVPKLAESAGKVLEWARGLGGSIIDGIVAGIRAAAHEVVDAITGVAGSAVDHAKSILGIGSPSKVFRDEVGRQITAGIAQGIGDHMPRVHAALAGAGRVPDLAGAGSGGGGRVALTITNWIDGEGYMEAISDRRVAGAARLATSKARMRRAAR